MALAARAGGLGLWKIPAAMNTSPLASIFAAWSSRTLLSSSIVLPAITISIPGLVADIWEGILKAVPKKKTSHMKKRHRQLAGKALKDVKAVNQCPGCGRPKKAHTLCPYCVAEIYDSWRARDREAKEMARMDDSAEHAEIEEQRMDQEKAK